MLVEPPHVPQKPLPGGVVPGPLDPPPPLAATLADLINENAAKACILLPMAAAGLVWLAVSLFSWLVFTSAGGYVLLGLCALFALSRIGLTLIVLGGFAALALLDQSISVITAFFIQWWPLAIGLVLAVAAALVVEAAFFRR